ncbi:MAG: hypothetical protein FJ349_02505 [Sphingomonadales bacterium]|nr:hypothetical protein [Sphingomonadales bacterium]
MLKYITYLIIGASLTACSLFLNQSATISYEVVNRQTQDTTGLFFLRAYQDTIRLEFNEIIAHTSEPLVLSRPCSNLMNWCADAVFISQTRNVRLSEPVICLLNTGGLRASFGAGNLTLADFYKLMPFDNRVVWVHLPVSKLKDISNYLLQSDGEPISNCVFKAQQLQIPNLLPSHQYIWVLTSDFLANGGDQMTFFLNEEKTETNLLLRDIFIAEAKQQKVLLLDSKSRYIK